MYEGREDGMGLEEFRRHGAFSNEVCSELDYLSVIIRQLRGKRKTASHHSVYYYPLGLSHRIPLYL